MTQNYNIFNNKKRKITSEKAEIKRHRRYMASKKWGIDYSYQSIKNIPDEVIFFRQNYNKVYSKLLRALKKSCNKSWIKVYRDIKNDNSFCSINTEKLDRILNNLVIKNVEIVRGIPYVLKSGNYYPLINTKNIFYLDEEEILRIPPKNFNFTSKVMGCDKNEWYVLKKDDNLWYRVTLSEKKVGKPLNHKKWILNHFSRKDLKGKVITFSSLSKKEKRKLLRRI